MLTTAFWNHLCFTGIENYSTLNDTEELLLAL